MSPPPNSQVLRFELGSVYNVSVCDQQHHDILMSDDPWISISILTADLLVTGIGIFFF